jgi:hypothetical protein
MWLIDMDDVQLRSGLGLTPEDIAVLRCVTSRNTRPFLDFLTMEVTTGGNDLHKRLGETPS